MKTADSWFLVTAIACAAIGACNSGGDGGTSTQGGGTSADTTSSGNHGGGGGATTSSSSVTSTGGGASVSSSSSSSSSGVGGDAGTGGGLDCTPPRCKPTYVAPAAPPGNPFTDDKAMLGKILFWDEQLSQTETMACGTCHRPSSGGSDPRTNDPNALLAGPDGTKDVVPDAYSDDLRVGQGVPHCDASGTITDPTIQVTARKPPSYLDAMFASQIFWDGRAGYCVNNEAPGGCFYDPDLPAGSPPIITGFVDPTSGLFVGAALESQVKGPPVSSVEMACDSRTWADVAAKLADTSLVPLAKAHAVPQDMLDFIAAHGSNYPALFAFAYGTDAKVDPTNDPDDVINTRRIAFAIATHERRLLSDQTPWDLWNDGTPAHDSAMTAAQIRGLQTFLGNARCGQCHQPPIFGDSLFHNLGFSQPANDIGRQATTGDPADLAKFKTSTLRNVGLREAFGLSHQGDGPGHNLKTMMILYNLGGQHANPVIGPLIDPLLVPINLTTGQQNDLLDFIRNALTDPRVTNELPPFDRPKLSTEP